MANNKALAGAGQALAGIANLAIQDIIAQRRDERLEQLRQSGELTVLKAQGEQQAALQGQREDAESAREETRINAENDRQDRLLKAQAKEGAATRDWQDTKDIRDLQNARINTQVTAAAAKEKSSQLDASDVIRSNTAIINKYAGVDPSALSDSAKVERRNAIDENQRLIQNSGILGGATQPDYFGINAAQPEPANYVERPTSGAPRLFKDAKGRYAMRQPDGTFKPIQGPSQ